MSVRVTRLSAKKAETTQNSSKTTIKVQEKKKDDEETQEQDNDVCDSCPVKLSDNDDHRYLPKKQRPQHSTCRKCDRHYWYTQADNEIAHPNEVVGQDICYACVAMRKTMHLFFPGRYAAP
jgi:uncharacterized protein with PIN domain